VNFVRRYEFSNNFIACLFRFNKELLLLTKNRIDSIDD